MSSRDNADDDAVDFASTMTRHSPEPPGQIRFDVRGNAIYEWTDARLAEDDERAKRLRNKALTHAGLCVVDDEPTAEVPVMLNDKGVRVGYNPYQSGLLTGKAAPKRRSLRELSEWIEMKRRLEQNQK